MKKIIMAVLFFSACYSIVACDVCGCSAGGDGWGIIPNYFSHYIGIKSQYRYFRSMHPADEQNINGISARDYFLRTDLSMRYVFTERFQATANLPYRYNQQVEENQVQTRSGLGDVSLNLHYLVLKPGCSRWKHALQLSAGSEMPTGKFIFSHEIPATLQTGSGTWDWLGGINYTLRNEFAGINLEAIYRLNGHTGQYDWGNTSTLSSRIFATIRNDSVSYWMPWTGISAEYFEPNIENMEYHIKAAYTGGQLMTWNSGLDYYSGRISVGLEVGIPVMNNLADGMSLLEVQAAGRFTCFINKIQHHKDITIK